MSQFPIIRLRGRYNNYAAPSTGAEGPYVIERAGHAIAKGKQLVVLVLGIERTDGQGPPVDIKAAVSRWNQRLQNGPDEVATP